MRNIIFTLIAFLITSCSIYSNWQTVKYSDNPNKKYDVINPIIQLNTTSLIQINSNTIKQITSTSCGGDWQKFNFKIWSQEAIKLNIINSKVQLNNDTFGFKFVKWYSAQQNHNANMINITAKPELNLSNLKTDQASWFQIETEETINCTSEFSLHLVFSTTDGTEFSKTLYFYPKKIRELNK